MERPVLTPRARLWVDPDSSTAHLGTPDAERLAAIPSATWLTGGDPYGDARRVTRAAAGAVPVIVEPDALAFGCVKTSLVKYAVERLAKLKRTGVYLDAGHSPLAAGEDDVALRDRHEPQRPRSVDRRTGLVPPAGPRPRRAAHHADEHAEARRRAVDQDPGRVRRRVPPGPARRSVVRARPRT
jgi:hypothetical protein